MGKGERWLSISKGCREAADGHNHCGHAPKGEGLGMQEPEDDSSE